MLKWDSSYSALLKVGASGLKQSGSGRDANLRAHRFEQVGVRSTRLKRDASRPVNSTFRCGRGGFLLESLEATILIVGDKKPVCDLLSQILSADHTCITASTVEEALMFMSNGFFDVVIADLRMSDDKGLALCDFIQQTHPEIVIIVISRNADKDRIALHGVFDCIEEPFEPAHIQMAVGRALSYSRLKRNLSCTSRPD